MSVSLLFRSVLTVSSIKPLNKFLLVDRFVCATSKSRTNITSTFLSQMAKESSPLHDPLLSSSSSSTAQSPNAQQDDTFPQTTIATIGKETMSKSAMKKMSRLSKEERKRLLKERRQKKKEHKAVGIGNEILKQTDYYFENGLRKVYPYYFGWNTTAKERWFNRTLLDIYSTEFSRACVNQSVQDLIETGKIRVNGQIKPPSYVVKNGDRISHVKHRHEIPVLDDQIKIIHEDDDYVVIDKPCSIPIHPCGKYRYNSLNIILSKELGFSNLRTMYRLDRLTSGLVIMAKNLKASLFVDKHIKERTAKKSYICRVQGEFPTNRILVDKAIDCASRKVGLHWVDEVNGKVAQTEFERLSFNGQTSVVQCFPKTGRTHQIRIHLQYLGYPIVNDPLYNRTDVWGKGNGKEGKYEFTKEEIEQNFLKVYTYETWIIKQEAEADNAASIENETSKEEDKESTSKRKEIGEREQSSEGNKKLKSDMEVEVKEPIRPERDMLKNQELNAEESSKNKFIKSPNRPGLDPKRFERDPECFECAQTYRDPTRKDLIMYLHAYSYQFDELKFKTELPEWAHEDFLEPQI